MSLLAFLPLGGLMGFLAGFLGTGGGTLAIPALILFFGYDQKLAQGTVLVMVVLNVFKGFFKYRGHAATDWRLVGYLVPSAGLAALGGALIAHHLDSAELQVGYGAFMLLLIIPMLLTKQGLRLKTPLAAPWAIVPGTLGGITLGLFGIGGAMLAVPFLTTCFGQNQVRAQGTALAVAMPGCLLSFIPYVWSGLVHWPVAILLVIGSLATVGWGVRSAHRVDERLLVAAFCGLLAATGISLLVRG